MQSANHALDILGRRLGLSGLTFDNDQIGLDMAEGFTLFLSRLSDTTVEASVLLEGLDFPDAAMMQALLEANYLGGATGPARLAIDADSAQVILCEGWILADLDAAALERRFDAFAAAAAFWLGEGTALLLDQAASIHEAATPRVSELDEGQMLRL